MTNGLAVHCHHNVLFEYCFAYDARVKYIKKEKPKNEQEIRLRLFQLLPQEAIDDLPKELIKAEARWQEAYAESGEAEARWQEADAKWRQEAYVKWQEEANAKWQEAYAKRMEAYAKCREVYAKWREAEARWQEADRKTWHDKWCGCTYWENGVINFIKE